MNTMKDAVSAVLDVHDDTVWKKWANDWFAGKEISRSKTAKVLARTLLLVQHFQHPSSEVVEETEKNELLGAGLDRMRLILSAAAMVTLMVFNNWDDKEHILCIINRIDEANRT